MYFSSYACGRRKKKRKGIKLKFSDLVYSTMLKVSRTFGVDLVLIRIAKGSTVWQVILAGN